MVEHPGVVGISMAKGSCGRWCDPNFFHPSNQFMLNNEFASAGRSTEFTSLRLMLVNVDRTIQLNSLWWLMLKSGQ